VGDSARRTTGTGETKEIAFSFIENDTLKLRNDTIERQREFSHTSNSAE